MGPRLHIPFMISILTHALSAQATTVIPAEDEFLLPPIFHSYLWNSGLKMGGGVTVVTKTKQKLAVGKDEWIEFGDEMNLPGELSFSAIMNEKLIIVGGGVFQGNYQAADRLVLKRGWVRVWKKEDALNPTFTIQTDQDEFQVKSGNFWINARNDVTDVYLLDGEIKVVGAGRTYGPKTYFSFEGKAGGAHYGAKHWDFEAMEVRIAGAFPGLMKLYTTTQKEWDSGDLSAIYADYRKKGWRNTGRTRPFQ